MMRSGVKGNLGVLDAEDAELAFADELAGRGG